MGTIEYVNFLKNECKPKQILKSDMVELESCYNNTASAAPLAASPSVKTRGS